MQPDVRRDFEFGRRFLPHLKMIVGQHLVAEAPPAEDAERATDLVVLRLDAVRIACRVRRHEYLNSYGHEFTIRSKRETGAQTELAKVLSGWARYMIYGFGSEGDAGPFMDRWVLGDLNVFRLWFQRETARVGRAPGNELPNGDGTWFRAFSLAALPSDFVHADSDSQMAAAA